MTEINKSYDPTQLEQNCYHNWEKKAYFSPSGQGESYCIMLPPPNVTGQLHMGHGFGFTLIDILIRYQRMCGKNVLWQGGTDHAGIATQMVVERQLLSKQQTRHDLGRDAFIEKIWQWKEESGDHISRQLRRLGASLDWSKEKFTLDPSLSYAVNEVFIELYNEGLIYRGKRLVNWDPVLLTAISDLEVINQEEQGHMWYIKYPLCHSSEYVVVATTRPETLFGDVAVAVNPDDERYQHLIGHYLQLPLTERTIPIIGDHDIDPEFGTGCVKITPGHDFNDYTIGKRHEFTPINILTPHAHLNENVPSAYQGLSVLKAREQVVTDLNTHALIEKIEPHVLKVPRGDRSHAIIEPYLTWQWYIKCKPLAEPAIEAVKNGRVRFIPENWDKTYYQWMDNIEDWCISRQLWWGHRIPVWYDDAGRAYVGQDEQDIRSRYHLDPHVTLKQDEDVLDTWFSSALWPFSTLGWPKQTEDLANFFPTQVLVTGFDIIFFWVARMIMMSLKFTGQVPFKEVYITGLIRDAEGHKMSKSKGNVLDPIDLIDGIELDSLIKKRTQALMQPAMAKKIEKATRQEFPEGITNYGTDALRFTFCSLASYTREIRFDINRLAGYRNFCNKLWNASRYVLMNTEGKDLGLIEKDVSYSLPDQWIRSRLQKTIEAAKQALSEYRFDYFAQVLYEFTWNEFCDWYLELSKPILTSEQSSAAALRGTRQTLVLTLESLLRLIHPIMPFITETIWQRLAPMTHAHLDSIMISPYPTMNQTLVNEEAEHALHYIRDIIIAIRTIRSEMNISPAKHLELYIKENKQADKTLLTEHQLLLTTLAKLHSITWIKEHETPPPSASAFVGQLELFIGTEGIIDKQEEFERLKKERDKLIKEKDMIVNKLDNPQFIERAPEHIIAKEKQKLVALETKLQKINGLLEKLSEPAANKKT